MSPDRLNIYLVVVMTLLTVCDLGKVTFTTKGDGSFVNLIQKGVVVAGKSSIVFSVKACADAVIVVSDIMAIKDTAGNYFLLMIGSQGNAMVIGQDSCFTCNRTKTTAAKVLDCGTMKDFWIQWDKTGLFETGTGTAVGVNTLLTLKGQKDKYTINTAAITSMKATQALWQFTSADLTTTFRQPVPSGSTVVEISETAPVGSDVLDIVLNPPNENTTFNLNGKTSDMFYVNKTKIKLAKSLDYETKQFHTLSISTLSGLAASMTIVVLNAIDEIPQVNASDLVIPEELPVGTVIGWNLTVFDPDTNDKLFYKIEGAMSDLLTILPNGNLQVIKRIDREAMDNARIVSNLTVTVSDAKPHNVTVTVLVEIKDMNDNKPQFNQTIHRTETKEKPANDTSILTLSVWDVDDKGNGQVNLSILEGVTSFYLKNNTLYVKAGQLDYARTSSHEEIVIVQAVDLPDSGVPQSETVVVLVHVLQSDKQPFSWLSPGSNSQGRFKEIVMPSSTPSGSTVTTFEAATANSSDIIRYSITSNNSAEFDLNPHTGLLKTASKLEKPSYLVTVSATSGNISINGTLRVAVKQALHSNQTVRFDRSVYIVSKPGMGDEGKSLTNIRILAPNESAINISINDEGRKAFSLKRENNSWSLVARKEAVSMPSVIQLAAIDSNGTERDTSVVVVKGVFTIAGTHSTTLYETSLASTRSSLCPTQPSTEKVTATEEQHTILSTAVTTTTTTTTTTVPPTNFMLSTTMRGECPPPSRTKEAAYISVIATQGLIVAALLGFYVFKKLKRKKQNVIEPERRDPLGCEPEGNNSSRKGSIINEATCEDTILEIEDETKNRNHIYSKSGKEKTLDSLNRNSLKDVNIEKDNLLSQELDGIEVGKDCLEVSKSTRPSNNDSDDKASVTPDAAVPEEKQENPGEDKLCSTKEGESVADEPSELPNCEIEFHDDLNESVDACRKEDISQPEIQNEVQPKLDKTDDKQILTNGDNKINDHILNHDMIIIDSHINVGSNTMEEPLRSSSKGSLDGEKSAELWNLEGLTPAYSSHLTGNALRRLESPTQEDEKSPSVYAESTVNETVALSDFIAQDEDFEYTISRVEEGNRVTHDDTMATPVNIDSLPNFNLHHMYNRVQTSPSEEASPSVQQQENAQLRSKTSDEKEQKRVVNNANMERQNVHTKVSGQADAVDTLISRIGPSEGAGSQRTVVPQTRQPCTETASKVPRHITNENDNGMSSSDDDEEDEEEEKVVKVQAPVGNGTAPATTYIPSKTVATLNTEFVKQDVIKHQPQNIQVERTPAEASKSRKNGKKKKGEKKGKSKKKGTSKKKKGKGK